MLVEKDGISRDIDEKKLQEYLNKGYLPAEEKPKKATKG